MLADRLLSCYQFEVSVLCDLMNELSLNFIQVALNHVEKSSVLIEDICLSSKDILPDSCTGISHQELLDYHAWICLMSTLSLLTSAPRHHEFL
jgi:hypothetical protein